VGTWQVRTRIFITLAAVLAGIAIPRPARAGDCGLKVVISALHYDPALMGEPDEAVELFNNPNGTAVNLEGWTLTDGEYRVRFPAFSLGPRARVWVARQAASFAGQFGFPPP